MLVLPVVGSVRDVLVGVAAATAPEPSRAQCRLLTPLSE
jgi:hypothetical protein